MQCVRCHSGIFKYIVLVEFLPLNLTYFSKYEFLSQNSLFNVHKYYVTSLKTGTVNSSLAGNFIQNLTESFSFPESNNKSHACSAPGTSVAKSRGN